MWSRQSPLIHFHGGSIPPAHTRFVVRHRCVIDLHRRVIDASSVRHHNQSGEKRVVGDKDPEAAG